MKFLFVNSRVKEMPNTALSEDSSEHLCSGKSWLLVWWEDGSWSSFDPFPGRVSNKCYQPKSDRNNLTKKSVAHLDNSYQDFFLMTKKLPFLFIFPPPKQIFHLIKNLICSMTAAFFQCSLNPRRALVWIKSIWWSRNFCMSYLRPATSLLWVTHCT